MSPFYIQAREHLLDLVKESRFIEGLRASDESLRFFAESWVRDEHISLWSMSLSEDDYAEVRLACRAFASACELNAQSTSQLAEALLSVREGDAADGEPSAAGVAQRLARDAFSAGHFLAKDYLSRLEAVAPTPKVAAVPTSSISGLRF